MYGNVYERTSDGDNDTKLFHGGCWFDTTKWVNSTANFRLENFKRGAGSGFRLVKEIKGK